jgi:hypothetical protein
MAKASEMLMKEKKGGPSASEEMMNAGSAGLTKKLRIEYGKYNADAQTSGEDPKPWEEWLRPDYELDKRGLAYPVK